MKPITTILVVNNEEKLIRRCLESVKPVSDEIILIHDGKCVDASLKIASEFTKKVFEREKHGCMEPHLVDALYMAQHDWILRLDTDEYLSEDLIKHILELDLENSDFTHFKAVWKEHFIERSRHPEKIILFNKNHSVSIGMPHRAVEVSGPSFLLNGQLEHTPAYANYNFKELVFKKLMPFAGIEAKLRYLNPVKIYSLNSENKLPKKIIFRNNHPFLTAPFFAFRVYFRTLWEAIKSQNFSTFKRVFQFAHAHLIEQFILAYYMRKEKIKAKNRPPETCGPAAYDEDYFERGLTMGKSGYTNFHWMPELTIRMAYSMVKDLPIKEGSKILDFGCAKGYLTRAFRILNFEAYGADISDYAISKAENDVIKQCKLIRHINDLKKIFNFKFDWIVAKDVFEHIPEQYLSEVLKGLSLMGKKMFVAVPLGKDDIGGKFIVEPYDHDITHCTAKTDKWWKELFKKNGFSIEKSSFDFKFCKENWTSKWPKGNGFYVLKSK